MLRGWTQAGTLVLTGALTALGCAKSSDSAAPSAPATAVVVRTNEVQAPAAKGPESAPAMATAQPQSTAAVPGAGTGVAPQAFGPLTAPIVADHQAVAAFDRIPPQYIEAAKQKFRLHYRNTSHGSQILTGLQMLSSSAPSYAYPPSFIKAEYGDLGKRGDLTWESTTRASLASAGYDRNVVLWSWCSGHTSASAENIQSYLDAMAKLERDYPKVRFIYMTGRTDKWSADVTHANNKRIRDYCVANNKVLYDFEDIESYDPAGHYYADANDSCDWCAGWCASHPCPACSECAHSNCFNCYIKGKAFWWTMARLAGWSGQ